MSTVTYKVPSISCEGCANAIKRAVASLSGVLDVNVDVKTKQVVVNYDEGKIGPGAVKSRIEGAGYEAE